MSLKIDVKEHGAVTVVACQGAIIFGDEATSLRDRVKQLALDHPNLVLELSQVSYVDSGGLGAIIGILTSVRNARGDMKLCCLTERVRHVFAITKLLNVVEIHNSVEDAVHAFSHAAA
jgi:anti-sigma B factor antagonist